MQNAAMKKKIRFLSTVFFVLLSSILIIGWISKTFIWTELQPAFIGALVAAAGAIFAACIAYTGARENLEIASNTAEQNARQRIEFQKQQKTFQIQQATTELSQLREVFSDTENFLAKFDGATEAGLRDYVDLYQEVLYEGGITLYMVNIVEPFRSRLHQVFSRIQMMQNSIQMIMRPDAPDISAEARLKLSRSIKDRLAELRKLRGEIDEAIRHREREIDAMKREHA